MAQFWRAGVAYFCRALKVVPDVWVRGVPSHALSRRAEAALRAATAHLAGAVQRRHQIEVDGQLTLF